MTAPEDTSPDIGLGHNDAPTLQPAPAGKGLQNVGFLVGALVIATGLVVLTMTSFDDQIYYYTVAEADAQRAEIGSHEFRIKGNVVVGSLMARDGVLNEHAFALEAEGAHATVHYTGPLPDTFADEAEVIALGRFREDGVFVATEVVAKCPSRYEEQAPTARAQDS